MSDDNFYKAPDAELTVDNTDVDEFFTVSTTKLWIMHVLTFGMYDFYWFFRHWEHLKLKRSLEVWPVIRGLFFIFFVYSTFKEVEGAAKSKQLDGVPNLKLFAGLYYLIFASQMLSQAVFRDEFTASPWLALGVSIVISVLEGFLFVAMQRTANRVLGDPEGAKNSRISALNVVWILVLLLFFGLGIIGQALAS